MLYPKNSTIMRTRFYLDGKEISESVANAIQALNKEYIASGDFELMAKCQFKITKTEEEPNQEPETKEEEVEITEDDIKWIGDNIFHLVYGILIKSSGNPDHITFNYIKDDIIKKSWDGKSQFIISGPRVYPLDAVERYLYKDGRTVQDVFELWKQIAIEQYNQ